MLADDKVLYDKADLELMTTYQLREICRKNKIMNGVVDPLDKEELVRIILRSFGRQEELLIAESVKGGMERIQELFSECRLLEQDVENLRCNSILTAYRGLAIQKADAYTIPYRKQLAETNAFVISESGKVCTVLHARQKQGDTENLYLVKPASVEAFEGERKGYALYCVDKRTSNELYQLYQGGQNVVPEHLRVWKIPLMDFQVKEPVDIPLPMAIDFGSVNTTAGVYLDIAYMEKIGRMAGVLKLKENAVNYTLFDEEGSDEMLLPSVIGVTAVEDADYRLAFGRKAVELAAASYIDEGFCVFYDIKRWISDYEKEEEIVDRQGRRRWVSRAELLRRFFLYIIQETENRFKCRVRQVHISSPVKQKYRFKRMFQRVLPEYGISGEDMLDEGMAVLYNTIENMIAQKKMVDGRRYEALVVDCGGGTTDLCSYRFRIHDNKTSYRIEMQMAYENGDTDFGGNNLTYRIMQLLKIEFLHKCGELPETSAAELLEQMDTDVDRFVDEYGVKEYYRRLDAAYERAEELLPTRFAEYERYNRSDYYKVKNNFYTLFALAEQMKKSFYGHVGRLQITVGSPQSKPQGGIRQMVQEGEQQAYRIPLDKWKLSFQGREGLMTRKELPDVTFNIFQIELLLEGEVYGILQKFMEEMYESGRLGRFSFLKLTGQSCKIDLFKDALKEFVPGKMIHFRKRANTENADYELKMTCVDGVLKYLRDKRQGMVDVRMEEADAVIPYQVTAFTHNGKEVVLLNGTGDWKQAGCISRNLEELTLQMHLKDGDSEERYRFQYHCQPDEFTLQTNEEIQKIYGHFIRQEETDTIVNGEVKFFAWASREEWGYQVVPICRRQDELYLGSSEFYCFENDNWINSFYDGTK
ncbi:MAG: molecular chaperone [Lachnospiraceae bacterium]|nr:molecular chaperone [Lachnospiraceae bacterium]